MVSGVPRETISPSVETHYRRVLNNFVQQYGYELPVLAYEVCIFMADCYKKRDYERMKITLMSLGWWHRNNNYPDPTKSPMVSNLIQQINENFCPKRRIAIQRPCSIDELFILTKAYREYISTYALTLDDSCVDLTATRTFESIVLRNTAILLIAFWFGLTTAEVCGLTRADVVISRGSLRITSERFRKDKGTARFSFQLDRLPLLCPLTALEEWLAKSDESQRYLFPRLGRWNFSGPITSNMVQVNLNEFIKNSQALHSRINIRSLKYSLYFFLMESGWSRKKILAHVPLYKKSSSKNRINKSVKATRNRDSSCISADVKSKIIAILEKSRYFQCYS